MNEEDIRIDDELPLERETTWLTLAILLTDRKLFETLFSMFRMDSQSEDAKKAALAQIESAAGMRGMSFVEYMELLTDFAYWMGDLSELADLQGK
jgi:hypothetical protein